MTSTAIGHPAAPATDSAGDGVVLRRACEHALRYLQSLPSRPVAAAAGVAELRARLGGALPESGTPPEDVIDALVRDAEDGVMASSGGRFFAWVIGGTLPAALAADWLTAAWDQNAAAPGCAPAEAVVEEIVGDWLKQLLGLPDEASFGLVTGCQAAHTTALAAARHALLARRGFDVERQGLHGAPPLKLLMSEFRHESLMRSVRLLGLGTDAITLLPCADDCRIRMDALADALAGETERPVVVCLQAGDLNTGAFDDFPAAIGLARGAGAWVHVDGAFGLWAAASERHRHLLAGAEAADSWATDGHKWLNLPFDSGLVFVRDAAAHTAPFTQYTSYSTETGEARSPKDWNPEWSRRARGFPVYAALRSLGRRGVEQLVDRCCAHAHRLVTGIGALPGAELLFTPVINQGLVRFLDPGPAADHDRRTDDVIARIQADGTAFFGGATWRGMRVMRVSVCSWRTNDDDVDRTIEAVRKAIAA